MTMEQLNDVLPQTDILVMAMPATAQTVGTLNAERIALLPPHAVVVNVGRGSAVDQEALAAALNEGRIAGAALDVFVPEPLPKDHPLLTLDNVVASAHAGGNTKDNDINMVNYVYHNIVAFDRGEPLNTPGDIVNGEYLKK